jgi:signal-transduction protein with cAMP-binding, CBS, and nucleotidyltransferase domain
MRTNVIRQRVADFLERHTPFDALSSEDRLDLAGSGRVKFHESDEYVLRQGETPGAVVWVIQQGRVELLDQRGGDVRLCDVAGEGDILGLERFSGAGEYQYSARTGTDVILYGLSASMLESLAGAYPALRRFMQARASIEGAPPTQNRVSWLEREAPPVEILPLPVDGGTLPELAGPLLTRTLVRTMLLHRHPAILVRADGHAAVLRERDLALFSGHQPVRLLEELRRGATRGVIERLLAQAARLVEDALAQPRDVDECCLFGAEVLAALADACTRLAAAELAESGFPAPAAAHAWVAFGSSARHDATRAVTPTLAAIYDDTAPSAGEMDAAYFTALAGQTAAWFEAFGLPGTAWPDGAQPGMPLSEWRRLYAQTLQRPLENSLWARRGLLDLRFLAGDQTIFTSLQRQVGAELAAEQMAVALLANDTLNHAPPDAFFTSLAVDLDGARRDVFDIESAVLAPVADAARVYALAHGHVGTVATLDRLAQAAVDRPALAPVLREAGDAFRIGIYHASLAGQPHLDPARLDKYEQLLLKTALAAVQRFVAATVAEFVHA